MNIDVTKIERDQLETALITFLMGLVDKVHAGEIVGLAGIATDRDGDAYSYIMGAQSTSSLGAFAKTQHLLVDMALSGDDSKNIFQMPTEQ